MNGVIRSVARRLLRRPRLLTFDDAIAILMRSRPLDGFAKAAILRHRTLFGWKIQFLFLDEQDSICLFAENVRVSSLDPELLGLFAGKSLITIT